MFEGLFKNTPDYLNKKNNLFGMIVFAALFALVFINIYEPFNSREWKPDISEMGYFLYSSAITLAGMLVVVLSRIIMFHHCKRGGTLLVWHYVTWVLAEIVVMAAFFTLFELIAMEDKRDPYVLIKSSVANTSLVLLLPYSISWLYFSWADKKNKLEALQAEEALASQPKKGMIVFNDEKGEFKLSVQTDQLIYLEAADNYVKIHYINKNKLTHFMLRNTLKNLEGSFQNSNMVRCHRSYVVNFDKVKVLRKEKDGLFLALGEEHVPDIPVSKTYSERVMAKFSHYSV